MTRRVNELKDYFKEQLYKFAQHFALELLIIENAVTIPLNLPLGLALTEFIAETGFPTIAHHHDFHWERNAFKRIAWAIILPPRFRPTCHPFDMWSSIRFKPNRSPRVTA